MTPRPRIESDEVLFICLLAILSTGLGYRYGFGNQLENLPIVHRMLDPTFLENDFFVNSAVGFGPRYYYAHIVAALARWVPLPDVIIGLTLLVNGALVTVTHLATRDLLRGDKRAGFIAATLTVSVSSFALGLATNIHFIDFQPGSLAIPWALGAFWAGLRGRPVLAATLAAIASVPHPLYGVETGGLALATASVVLALDRRRRTPAARRRSVVACATGVVILTGTTLLLWGLPLAAAGGERLSTAEMVAILAEFRSPHHYLPSLFPLRHYAGFAAFSLAVALAWGQWARTSVERPLALAFLVAPLLIGLGCVGGLLFVEVWPSRLWLTAQPFRLLYLIKWQGYLLLGWMLAGWLRATDWPRRALGGLLLLGSSGGAQAPIAAVTVLLERLVPRFTRWIPSWAVILVAGVVVAGLLVALGSPRETLRALAGLTLAGALVSCPSSAKVRVVCVLMVAFPLAMVGVNRHLNVVAWEGANPVLVHADQTGADAAVARWARANTPDDAIFLTPPDLGSFRLIGRRAIVVDFKAMPFAEAPLGEWRERLRVCYGDVSAGGDLARQQMDEHYRGVSDETLSLVRDRYGARFAVLFVDTPTDRTVLYENTGYRLVAL